MTPAARHRQRVRIPVIAASAVAWCGLALSGHPSMSANPSMGGHPMHEMTRDVAGHAAMTALGLMLVAMMVPMVIGLLSDAVGRSLPRRRWRIVTALTTGYITVWVGAGTLLVLVAAAIRSTMSPAAAVATAAGVAVTWQWSPAKQRCLNRTHVHPATCAFGWAADKDAWCAGVTHACWCVGSCWGAMLATMLVEPGWQLAMMAVVSVWLWAERLDRPAPPAWSIRFPAKALRLARAQAHSLLTACSLT